MLVSLLPFAIDPSTRFCDRIFKAKSWLYLIGFIAADAVLILRTYVIYDNSKVVLYILSALLITAFAGGGYIADKFLSSLRFTSSPLPADFPGCFKYGSSSDVTSSRILWIAYFCIAIFELVILILIWIKIIHKRGTSESLLMRTLTLDGLTFYILILGMSIVNIIVLNTAPGELQGSLSTIHRVTHGVISARLILRLRKAVASNQQPNISVFSATQDRPRFRSATLPSDSIQLGAIPVREDDPERNSSQSRG